MGGIFAGVKLPNDHPIQALMLFKRQHKLFIITKMKVKNVRKKIMSFKCD